MVYEKVTVSVKHKPFTTLTLYRVQHNRDTRIYPLHEAGTYIMEHSTKSTRIVG